MNDKKMKKVLIIEDDLSILSAYIEGLTMEGFDVFGAVTGKIGLGKIEEENPDIILLDLILPDMSGEEVLQEMGKQGLIEKFPVIVCSNRAGNANITNCINSLGARDYLIKSESSLEEVVKRINRVLSNSSS